MGRLHAGRTVRSCRASGAARTRPRDETAASSLSLSVLSPGRIVIPFAHARLALDSGFGEEMRFRLPVAFPPPVFGLDGCVRISRRRHFPWTSWLDSRYNYLTLMTINPPVRRVNEK